MDLYGFEMTRRQFIKAFGTLLALPGVLGGASKLTSEAGIEKGVWVNDVHSKLNATRVAEVVRPAFPEEIQSVIFRARREGQSISMAGGRHSMGGQQFATDAIHVDTQCMNRVLDFDPNAGTIKVEAGIQWPKLMRDLASLSKNSAKWGIRQKPTGTDDISIGGSMSSNIHGRGLHHQPFIQDIESFELINASGERVHCSRLENPALFKRVIGGYGLFGVIYSATLRLSPRQKIRRFVQPLPVKEVASAIERVAKMGALYGDFQFEIDENSPDYLTHGILSYYKPVSPETSMSKALEVLSTDDWKELVTLAHEDKGKAFEKYKNHYLKTNGQLYWSDTHQLGPYRDNYHELLDWPQKEPVQATEMITEVYVPRSVLSAFLKRIRQDFRRHQVNLIYGTVRFIEKDDESFLPWAKDRYASIVLNLHTPHSPEGLAHSAKAFRLLIDRAIAFGGSFYLTYHRWATPQQILKCYPQFQTFLDDKLRYDPDQRFQSNWYRHYQSLFN